MAIEITEFNYPTVPTSNIDEVYEWLVANASEFFPGGIVKNASANNVYIRCYPIEGDDRTQMVIPFYNSDANAAGCVFPKYATTTYQINPNGQGYASNAYRKAVKTSCGFVLMAHGTGATWFVSKTENGNVCTYAIGSQQYNNNRPALLFCDLENDSVPTTSGTFNDVASLVAYYRPWTERQITTLLPIVFSGGTYTTNLLMTQFTQATFSANLQTVLIDGTEYIYDGFVALKA